MCLNDDMDEHTQTGSLQHDYLYVGIYSLDESIGIFDKKMGQSRPLYLFIFVFSTWQININW